MNETQNVRYQPESRHIERLVTELINYEAYTHVFLTIDVFGSEDIIQLHKDYRPSRYFLFIRQLKGLVQNGDGDDPNS